MLGHQIAFLRFVACHLAKLEQEAQGMPGRPLEALGDSISVPISVSISVPLWVLCIGPPIEPSIGFVIASFCGFAIFAELQLEAPELPGEALEIQR